MGILSPSHVDIYDVIKAFEENGHTCDLDTGQIIALAKKELEEATQGRDESIAELVDISMALWDQVNEKEGFEDHIVTKKDMDWTLKLTKDYVDIDWEFSK